MSDKKPKPYAPDDLFYALNLAAEALDLESWSDDDGAQNAAYREASRRIRRMAERLPME